MRAVLEDVDRGVRVVGEGAVQCGGNRFRVVFLVWVGLILSCVGLARLGFAWFRGSPGHLHGLYAHGVRACVEDLDRGVRVVGEGAG